MVRWFKASPRGANVCGQLCQSVRDEVASIRRADLIERQIETGTERKKGSIAPGMARAD